MIEKMYDGYGYDEGYAIGWDEGKQIGYIEGYNDAVSDYEPRLARYNTELLTLNARISYLEKLTGGTNE